MTSGSKKAGKKPVDEKPVETSKVESSTKICLIVFKETQGIDNMTYAGFKTALNSEDDKEYTQKELEKKFEEYKAQNAFIKK